MLGLHVILKIDLSVFCLIMQVSCIVPGIIFPQSCRLVFTGDLTDNQLHSTLYNDQVYLVSWNRYCSAELKYVVKSIDPPVIVLDTCS